MWQSPARGHSSPELQVRNSRLAQQNRLVRLILVRSFSLTPMQPLAAERRHLERQITFARPILMVLALVDLLERPPAQRGPHAVLFITAYLCVSLVLAAIQNLQWIGEVRLPLPLDLAALAAFLLLTQSVVAFWFLYLFVALAVGIRWRVGRLVILAGVVSFCLLGRTALHGRLAL